MIAFWACLQAGVLERLRINQAQPWNDPGANHATIQAYHILNELTMQYVYPTMNGEKCTATNKVRVVTMFRVLRCPPLSTPSFRRHTMSAILPFSNRTSDPRVSPKESLQQTAYTTLGICPQYRPAFVTALATWSRSLKAPKR